MEQPTFVNQETKKCTKCGKVHSIEYFNWENKSKGKRHSHCKDCTKAAGRERRIKNGQKTTRRKSTGVPWSNKPNFERRWGITVEDKENLIRLYSGGTGKCGNPACGSTEDLVLDHDHETNQIRGVLCNTCNRSLGGLGDTWEAIQGIYEYMEKHYEDGRGFTITVNKKVHQ
jgi:hypothetical protein